MITARVDLFYSTKQVISVCSAGFGCALLHKSQQPAAGRNVEFLLRSTHVNESLSSCYHDIENGEQRPLGIVPEDEYKSSVASMLSLARGVNSSKK